MCLIVFENARKNIIQSAFFVFVLYCTKRRWSEIKPLLKVEKDYVPSMYIPLPVRVYLFGYNWKNLAYKNWLLQIPRKNLLKSIN